MPYLGTDMLHHLATSPCRNLMNLFWWKAWSFSWRWLLYFVQCLDHHYTMNLGNMFKPLQPSCAKSKKFVGARAWVALTPSRWTAVGISTLLLMTCYVPGAGPLTWRWSLSSWVRWMLGRYRSPEIFFDATCIKWRHQLTCGNKIKFIPNSPTWTPLGCQMQPLWGF